MHFVDHRADLLAQTRRTFVDYNPTFQSVFRETENLVGVVLVRVVLLFVVIAVGVMRRDDSLTAEDDIA